MNQPDNFPELSIGQHAPDHEQHIRTVERQVMGAASLDIVRRAHEIALHGALDIEHME
jgi:hypothetical protein